MTVRVSLLGLLIVIAQSPSNPPAGFLIRHGPLRDGNGAPPRHADVRLAGDAISEIGEELAP